MNFGIGDVTGVTGKVDRLFCYNAVTASNGKFSNWIASRGLQLVFEAIMQSRLRLALVAFTTAVATCALGNMWRLQQQFPAARFGTGHSPTLRHRPWRLRSAQLAQEAVFILRWFGRQLRKGWDSGGGSD